MIFRLSRRFAMVLLVPLIAACAFSPTEGIHRAMTVDTAGQAVVIQGPAGFCIDERTVDETRTGAFVFLSDCAANPNGGAATIARVPISAVLTASVSNSGLPGSLAALQTFLETPIGQLSLGKSGNPRTITVLLMERTETAVFAYVEDTTVTTSTGESPRYWRAFTEVNGRLLALSATGYDRYDPEQLRIKRIIEEFVESLHTANPAS